MNDSLWDEIEAFVRSERGMSNNKSLSPATMLEDDLGITGIEGEMFMEAFFARFNVNVGDFASGRYFMDEGSGLLLMLFTALSKKRRSALNRVPLTLGMLATAARLGQWDSQKVEAAHAESHADAKCGLYPVISTGRTDSTKINRATTHKNENA